MIRVKKVVFLILLPLIVQLVIFCCPNCDGVVSGSYTKLEVDNLDNSGIEALIATGDSITRNAFGIRIHLERDKISCKESPNYNSIIPSANAFRCECLPDHIVAEDSITAIKVITLQNFDTNHLSGDDISSYFQFFKNYHFTSIADYVANLHGTLDDASELNSKIDLLLAHPPLNTGMYQFKIQILLSDGRILEAITSEIKLI